MIHQQIDDLEEMNKIPKNTNKLRMNHDKIVHQNRPTSIKEIK